MLLQLMDITRVDSAVKAEEGKNIITKSSNKISEYNNNSY